MSASLLMSDGSTWLVYSAESSSNLGKSNFRGSLASLVLLHAWKNHVIHIAGYIASQFKDTSIFV